MKRRASDGRPAGSEWWTAVIGVVVVSATSVAGISRRITHPCRSYTIIRASMATIAVLGTFDPKERSIAMSRIGLTERPG